MIDTVILSYPISLSPHLLERWVYHPLIFPNGRTRHRYFQSRKSSNGATIYCKYYPANPPSYIFPRLSIQVSLPNVLYGSNVKMITQMSEIEQAINLVNQIVKETAWLPKVNLEDGILWQLDLVFNHQVGELVQGYVHQLSKLEYPNRKTEPYLKQGVQFRSKTANLKFYDKELESSSPDAHGILRQESVLRHTYFIERRLGIRYPTLKDIDPVWVQNVLTIDLLKLHLTDKVITERSTAQMMLVEKYGWSQGNKLFGYLSARQAMSKKQIISAGMKDRTVRKYEHQIHETGLSLLLVDDGLQLPPLRIGASVGTFVPFNLNDTKTDKKRRTHV